MWDAAVFDFDGTLVDTSEGIFFAVNHALEAMGRDRDDDPAHLSQMIGPPIREGFAVNYGITDPAVVTAFRTCYGTEGLHRSRGYFGMEALLADLRRAGVRLGIATLKPEEFARVILTDLGWTDYFDAVVGAPMDGSDDDKASLVAKALARLGITDPARTVMIGDRRSDVVGGKKNGMGTVYCRYGFGPVGEDREAAADFCVDNVDGLRSVLL